MVIQCVTNAFAICIALVPDIGTTCVSLEKRQQIAKDFGVHDLFLVEALKDLGKLPPEAGRPGTTEGNLFVGVPSRDSAHSLRIG